MWVHHPGVHNGPIQGNMKGGFMPIIYLLAAALVVSLGCIVRMLTLSEKKVVPQDDLLLAAEAQVSQLNSELLAARSALAERTEELFCATRTAQQAEEDLKVTCGLLELAWEAEREAKRTLINGRTAQWWSEHLVEREAYAAKCEDAEIRRFHYPTTTA
jgi:hypothetical protein